MEDRIDKIQNIRGLKKLTRKMQAKFLFVFCAILGICVVLIVRLFYLAASDKYEKHALELRTYTSSEIQSKRGDILDRNGELLATSELYYRLILDPSVVTDKSAYIEPTTKALIEALGIEKEKITTEIDENKDLEPKDKKKYVILKKNLKYDDVLAFDDYVSNLNEEEQKNIKGVWFEEEYKRVYPYGKLASHIVGFTLDSKTGSYGVEQYYNDILCGTNGRTYGYYDSELNIVETLNPPVDGTSIVTTIDVNVQRILQECVEKFLDEYGALNCAAIVMDANNAEILGMQSNYSYDLNNHRDLSVCYSEEEISAMSDEEKTAALFNLWRNFCISDAIEPGSIYKPFTVAAGLEESIISVNDRFVCDGHEDFPGDVRIKCSNKRGHGDISLAQSIMFSCNDALMQIAAKEGGAVFNQYQQDYCIGSLTGIDLPGETEGKIFSVKELNPTELATSSFGQGFTTTMIQMASSFCALINGGTYYEPHVVKRLQNSAGATVQRIEPLVVNKTTSEATSNFLKESLYLTVSDGTGKAANLNGYRIGGKTGTSQKLPRDAEKYLVSFLGFIENGDKCYIIYVIVDECENEEMAMSSNTAIGIFNDIADRCLPFLGVYPEGEIDYHLEIIMDEDLLIDENNPDYDPEENEASPNVLGDTAG